MSIWAEVWTRPGDASFGRVIDYLPSTNFGLFDALNRVGRGNASVADTFDRFDEILLIDPNTPANSVASLVRYFSDSDPTTPIFEWLPNLILPKTDKIDRTVEITGDGIDKILEYARTEAYDWDGSDDWVPEFPDWIYGGRNVVQNPSFEAENAQPIIYELLITATGGTYTLSDGTDTTSAIAFDATESTIETRIEADIAAITDVVVDPIDGGFTIEFKVPAVGVSLTVNTGSLTGGSATLTLTQEGVLQPDPWTKSQQINVGTPKVFGCYDTFEVTTEQARTGTHSLKIDPCDVTNAGLRFAGVQQVINVQPGGTYQASIWVRPTSATNTFRFVLRTLGGEEIERDQQSNIPANTWTEFSISDLIIPDGLTQIILRFADITAVGSNPAVFYVDDGAMNEGLSPTTAGEILGDLYDDATSNHSPDRVVWEIGSSGTPYLTLDFTDSVDSAGAAWVHSEIQIRIWMRMTYLQVIEQLSRGWGYEWRVVPNDVENGTWKLQVYNPGTMKTDYTSAASPAIQGGSSDVRRAIRRHLPATDYMVEGESRITARDRDSDLLTALGRIESSRLDRQLPSQSATADAAFEDKVDAIPNSSSYSYVLVNPQDEPLTDYVIGDLLTIHDPPQVEDSARLFDITATFSPGAEEWEVDFVPATAVGS